MEGVKKGSNQMRRCKSRNLNQLYCYSSTCYVFGTGKFLCCTAVNERLEITLPNIHHLKTKLASTSTLTQTISNAYDIVNKRRRFILVFSCTSDPSISQTPAFLWYYLLSENMQRGPLRSQHQRHALLRPQHKVD